MISTPQMSLSVAAARPIENQANPPTPRLRIAWIDYARGLSILMVVLGHVILGLQASELLSDGPLLRIWDARFYNVRMPLFFTLSGIFAERWVGRSTVDFLRDKGATIVYPFFVWGILQTSIQAMIAPITNGNMTLWHVLRFPVLPAGQFWFLHVLFYVMLGYFLLRKLGLGPIACLAVALGGYAMQGDWPQGSTIPLELVGYYAPFYAVGGVAGAFASWFRIERPAHLAAVMVAGFGALIAATRLGQTPPLPIQLTATLCGIGGAIALTSLLSRSRLMGFLPVIGRYSLEILVIHIFSAMGLRLALHRILHVENAAVHLILGTIAGIVGPLLVVWLCNRLGFRYAFRLPRPAKPARLETTQPAPRPSLSLARATG